MENPLAVANYFIQKSMEIGELLTPMKLVKLVYIAHGWYLGLTGEPLINEAVEAWKYGPVVPSIYHTFKNYGGSPISQTASYITDSWQPVEYSLATPQLEPFLDRIWEVYHGYTGVELSAMTHQNDTPWQQIWESKGKFSLSETIPNDLIRVYYQTMANVPEPA